jgi:FtsP/CotA-like multicopper oxidase with cupredoxin domain
MKSVLLPLMIFVSSHILAQNPILIPDTLSETDIDLTLQNGTHQFYSGINTNTMGVNGNILGPTLLLNQGDFVDISIDNQLADTTTIHWHGMHVSAENDGGPHIIIEPNSTWNPSFTVLDKAATYWYHPHLHRKTNEHVSKGIAGFIIVRDEEEAALNLPRKYGVDDFPIVIQTKDFHANNEIVVPSNSDDVVMVNATIDPALEVPAQVVRLRLLNGSSMRVFNIGLNGNQTFHQIASDGGLLSNSIALTRLQLAPGERAEILVNFSGMEGQTLFLKSYASEFPNGIYGATNPGMGPGMTLTGYNPNPLNGNDFDVMQFDVIAQNTNPVTTIPTTLVTVNPIPESSANITRNLTMSPVAGGPNQLNGNFLINNVSFELDVINYTIPLDNIEIWSIFNQSGIAHPFHIHDVQFFVLDRNGVAPPLSEQGRKDDILIKPMETVRFIIKFDDFASDTYPFMYHCHMLIHEDGGMMGQFLVVDNMTGNDDLILENEISIYPNPTTGLVHLETDDNLVLKRIEIFDLLGRTVLVIVDLKNGEAIDLGQLSKGIHFLKISSDQGDFVKKIVIE